MSSPLNLKTRIIHIDSNDFENPSSGELFVSLSKPIMNCRKFKVLSFNIPYSWFNITASNNCFIINSISYFLAPGSYSCNTIASVLQAKFRTTIDPNFTIDFSTSTGKFFFHSTSTFTINYGGNTLGQFLKIFSQEAGIIASNIPPTFLYSITSIQPFYIISDGIANVLRTPEIQIRTSLTMSLSSNGSSSSDNLLVSVPVQNVSFGSIISTSAYPNIMDLEFIPRNDEIADIFIQITDINKQLLGLNNQQFTITFQFYYYD
jgi:hypothetical protein